jgi:hypothetical protein
MNRRGGLSREIRVLYLMPSRIGRGWGDVSELARFARALSRTSRTVAWVPPTAIPRSDPRVEPVDPARTPLPFPPLQRWSQPRGKGSAVVLITWWGVTGRRVDEQGRPLPGPWASTLEVVRAHHGRDRTLVVSLEEFASARTAREVLTQMLWSSGERAQEVPAHLSGPEGTEFLERYRRAYRTYRGLSAPHVLHVVTSFRFDEGAWREFPEMLQVGPAWGHPPRRAFTVTSGRWRILWYASPPSSLPFARRLTLALRTLKKPMELHIRGALGGECGSLASGPARGLEIRFHRELRETAWRRLRQGCRLIITTGSQSLLECLDRGQPFLYFNGIRRTRRGWRPDRPEKIESLLRAREGIGADATVSRDLRDFAAGRNLRRVLGRALMDPLWRADVVRRPSVGMFPLEAADGGLFVARLLRRFETFSGPVDLFVQRERERYRQAVRDPRRPPDRTGEFH